MTEARYIVAILAILLVGYLAYTWRLRAAVSKAETALSDARGSLEARSRVLSALHELGNTLTGERNTEAIAGHIVRQIQRGTSFDCISIFLVDDARQFLRGVVGVNEQGRLNDISEQACSMEDALSPLAQVARGEREYFLANEAASDCAVDESVKFQGLVPLRTADRVLGVVTVDNPVSRRPFGESEVWELRSFADVVALAFHNSQLLSRANEQQAALAQRNRELSALVAFGQASSTARSVDGVVRSIWSTVREGLGFDRVGIFLREGEIFRGSIGSDENGNMEVISGESWPAQAQMGGWPSLVTCEREFDFTRNLSEDEGIFTRGGSPIGEHILVALTTQERVIGAISVDNLVTGRPLSEADAQPLVAFARQAAMALQRVMLLEALQTSEERLRMLVTSLSETLYSVRVADDKLIPLYYSPRFEELTGYSLDEALAGPDFWLQLIHPDDRLRYQDALLDVVLGGSTAIEYRIVHRSGESRWVLDTPTPIRNEDGAVIRLNGALLDITERKAFEEGLRRAQKMETVGALAGGIAHEFNNLLGIILGNIEFAQMDAGEANPAQESLRKMRKAAERAAELTKQLLTFSAKIESRRVQISVGPVVEETLHLLRSSLGKGIGVEAKVEPNLEDVIGDAGLIQQVLINLCVNARDAMPEGGTIRVSAANASVTADCPARPPESPVGPYVVLAVSDNGTGIDAFTQERIFEPFFTTKPLGRGTGLGLAVAYGIIDEHNGWIEVESEPGKGTTFRIFLPGARAVPPSPDRDADLPPTALVIDASPTAREGLVDILEGLGFATLTAATASEALAIFWTDSDMVDLVISDARPAGMDIEMLIANMRDFKPDIQVLIGSPLQSLDIANLDGARATIIRKPYDAEEIARAAGAGKHL